jgi:CheY-like chemotaxis protein
VLGIQLVAMARPAILIAEPEPQQALSTRKLVVETGKFNVLTAHSTQEALDTFSLFPNISAVVLVISDAVDADFVASTIKSARGDIPVICLTPSNGHGCRKSDYTISSFEPQQLLDRLRTLLGDPRNLPA